MPKIGEQSSIAAGAFETSLMPSQINESERKITKCAAWYAQDAQGSADNDDHDW